MRVRRFAAGCLCACLTVLAVGVTTAAARTDNRSKPLVYVHGLDAFGTAGVDCNMWSTMDNRLRAWGHTGTKVTVMYYEGDVNCTYSVDHHASHAKHWGGSAEHNSAGTSHTANTQIEHLGYHLMWMIYDHFGTQPVDVVAHSMGGLITRYGLAQVQRNHADFPPDVNIEDIVTLGTPHGGSGWGDWCGWADQCDQIGGDDYFLGWLRDNAQNPQGYGGTDWTTMGSYDDTYVSTSSAQKMDSTHRVNYLGSMDVGHSDYYVRTSDTRDADVEYWDRPGPWYAWYDGPHPVRWSDYALYSGGW
jgi:pimeloyl-ACP methyl ester carboxylesterase